MRNPTPCPSLSKCAPPLEIQNVVFPIRTSQNPPSESRRGGGGKYMPVSLKFMSLFFES